MTAINAPWAEQGLRVLVEGPENPTADIVAVHGLAANPAYTWLKFPKDSKSLSQDGEYAETSNTTIEGVHWLKDLLPKTIDNVRIMMFNYNSDYLFSSAASRHTLRSIATDLLEAIAELMGCNSQRPIIFVGHSFGGIVIQEALVFAKQEDRYRNIVLSTAGIIFLGTPHRGSKLATRGGVATNCARALGYKTNDNLLKVLQENNDRSITSLSDFTCMARVLNIHLTCFYELRETVLIKNNPLLAKCTTTMLVEMSSAVLDGYHPIALDTDHSKMNKYDSAEDPNYKKIQYQLQLLVTASSSVVHKRTLNNTKKHFLIPYQQNDAYTPRDEMLKQLDTRLAHKGVNEQIRIAVHGLGGSGKTQFVLDYAYKTIHVYEHIFWIHGATTDFVITDVLKLSRTLGFQDVEPVDAYAKVKEWLDSVESENWLLIIDNVDEITEPFLKTVRNFLPIRRGTIIFTTRDRGISGKLLSRKSENCLSLSDSMTDREAFNTFDYIACVEDYIREECCVLFKMLGHLPLAIVQAASYISQNGVSVSQYLDHLRTNDYKILRIPIDDDTQVQDHYTRSVMTTWKISYDSIKSRNSLATKILDVMSLLDYQEIPKTLLRSESLDDHYHFENEDGSNGNGDNEDYTETKKFLGEDIEFEQAIGVLKSFSLISSSLEAESTTYRTHRLVSLWTRHNIQRAEAVRLSVLRLVQLDFPCPQEDNILSCRPLAPHVQAVLASSQDYPSLQGTRIELMSSYGYYLDYSGSLQKAHSVLSDVLEYHKVMNNQDKLISCWFSLGRIDSNQGRYDDALEWYNRALAGREKVLGKDHPSTLETVHNMAVVFDNQGKYDDALEWYNRALVGSVKVLGKDHPSTLNTMNNIAVVLNSQGKYDDALEWYNRTLAGREKVLGKDHLSTLSTMNNMAVVFKHQGKYDDALEWYNRTLASKEKILGKDHPSTLNTVHNMAVVFASQGKYDDALEWYNRALAGREKVLGKDHPSTLSTVNNIAIAFDSQEKYDDALEWYNRALAGREKALGKDHPSTLNTVLAIGHCYRNQDKYVLALEYFRRAAVGYQMVFQKDHERCVDAYSYISELELLISEELSEGDVLMARTSEADGEVNDEVTIEPSSTPYTPVQAILQEDRATETYHVPQSHAIDLGINISTLPTSVIPQQPESRGNSANAGFRNKLRSKFTRFL